MITGLAAVLLGFFVFWSERSESPKGFVFEASLVIIIAAVAANFARNKFHKTNDNK